MKGDPSLHRSPVHQCSLGLQDTWGQIAAQSHSSARTLKIGVGYSAQGEAPTATVYSVQQKKAHVGQAWSYLATRSNSRCMWGDTQLGKDCRAPLATWEDSFLGILGQRASSEGCRYPRRE